MALARICFTGKLASMSRREAANAVSAAGGATSNTIGRQTTMLVVGMDGWPLLADGSVSQKLARAQELAAQGSGIQIVSEERFLEMIGLKSRTGSLRKTFTPNQICQLVGIDELQLRRWEYAGLVHSTDGRFDFQDIVSLKTIAELIGRGVKPQVIARSMSQLASVLPGTDRPLAQLKLVSEPSGKLLAEVGGVLLEPCGQIRLNFDGEPAAGFTAEHAEHAENAEERQEIRSALSTYSAAAKSAETWFEEAVELEAEERFEEAEHAYREAIAMTPSMAAAHFNLANVLLAMNRNEAAQERLRVAIEHEPEFAMAWFNLGCLCESAGRLDEAIKHLDRAVAIDPLYADAHFNLASCYERMGRLANAAHHWKAYLGLDNSSPWAEHARANLRRA